MMLAVLKESNGIALTITEKEMEDGVEEIAKVEGLLLSPEGSATYIAAEKLLKTGWAKPSERILLVNTGSWYKYR